MTGPTLTDLRDRYTCLHAGFLATIDREFPGRGEWDWYRALQQGGRRNTDTSDDDALAASETIRAAHDAFIKALHEFYRARDGERGVLGAYISVDNQQKRG